MGLGRREGRGGERKGGRRKRKRKGMVYEYLGGLDWIGLDWTGLSVHVHNATSAALVVSSILGAMYILNLSMWIL